MLAFPRFTGPGAGAPSPEKTNTEIIITTKAGMMTIFLLFVDIFTSTLISLE